MMNFQEFKKTIGDINPKLLRRVSPYDRNTTAVQTVGQNAGFREMYECEPLWHFMDSLCEFVKSEDNVSY